MTETTVKTTTVKLTTWSLSKKKALKKLNNNACVIFEKVIDGLQKEGVCLESAACTPVSLKGFLFYVGTYKIDVIPQKKTLIVVRTKITNYKEPTEKQIKETPKKVYKKQNRDSKGRFKKKGK